MGGPPSGEGPDRCGTPVRVLVAMAGVSLRLSLAPWLLALQLLQFKVDRRRSRQGEARACRLSAEGRRGRGSRRNRRIMAYVL